MTKQELIQLKEDTYKEKRRLESEFYRLDKDFQDALDKYRDENARFNLGDDVIYLVEKYKTPRKYQVINRKAFVQNVWDNEKRTYGQVVKILYQLATAKGYRPNSGWYVEETDIKEYEKN